MRLTRKRQLELLEHNEGGLGKFNTHSLGVQTGTDKQNEIWMNGASARGEWLLIATRDRKSA